MILLILMLLSSAGFTYLFYSLNQTLYLLPVWIICSILISFIILFFVIYCIFVPIFKRVSPTNAFKHFICRHVMCFLLILTRTSIKVENKEKLVKKTKDPLVIVGNHKSLLDGPWFYKLLNRPASVVAKDTLNKNPFFPPLSKAFNVVCVDRENDRKAAKAIIEGSKLIANGLPIIIYPEGGIKDVTTEQMVVLRPGAYKLATRANAIIQPIAIHNSTKVAKRFPLLSWTKVTLKVLDPIMPEFYKDKNTTELGLEIAAIVNATFDEPQITVEVL